MLRLIVPALILLLAACSDSSEQSAVEPRQLPEPETLGTVDADDIPAPLAEPVDDDEEDLFADAGRPAGQIYNQYCVMCHGTGAAGAPRLGDTAAWQRELDHHSLDEIIQNAIEGEGAMPPRGGCMECSDDEIAAVTRFMIEESGIQL